MGVKLNVLSLFDGMSCARVALDRAGIGINRYFAAETDKHAIKVAQANYPDTIQLGDVRDVMWPENFELIKINLLIGGSPCQGFSFAGKQLNFDDPRSALFWEYVRLLKETRPRYFLLENVKMNKRSQEVISEALGVDPVPINSSLVSAQNRQRLYWTNIPFNMPTDLGVTLRDILEDKPKEFTVMSDKFTRRNRDSKCLVSVEKDKAASLSAMEYVKNGRQGDYIACHQDGSPNLIQEKLPLRAEYTQEDVRKNDWDLLVDYEASIEAEKQGIKVVGYADRFQHYNNDQIKRVYDPAGKSPTLLVNRGGNREIKVADTPTTWRKLTPIECERLQTVPDNYTAHVSNTQRYKMLGNGFTVDVIAQILRGILEPACTTSQRLL